MRDLRLYASLVHSRRPREVFVRLPMKLAIEKAERSWKWPQVAFFLRRPRGMDEAVANAPEY